MKTEIVNGQVLTNDTFFVNDTLTIDDESIIGIGFPGEKTVNIGFI